MIAPVYLFNRVHLIDVAQILVDAKWEEIRKRLIRLLALARKTRAAHEAAMGLTKTTIQRGVKVALLVSLVAAGGCSRSDSTGTVMGAVLKTLTADGKSVCIDRATSGEPLAIFRTMASAPDPARRPLAWFPPNPLRSDQNLSVGRLVDDEFTDQRTVLARPKVGRQPLPLTEQRRLDAAATKLSYAQVDRDAVVTDAASVPKAHARWWVLNRLDSSCTTVYTASPPVIVGDMAFVSVLGNHWGTTYAVEKRAGVWSTTAQWSNWLY